MPSESFLELLNLIAADITKQTTNMRDPIPPELKLAATIRYLSTGATFTDLQYIFRIYQTTLSRFIPIVCDALFRALKENYVKVRTLYFSFFFLLITAKLYDNSINFQNLYFVY